LLRVRSWALGLCAATLAFEADMGSVSAACYIRMRYGTLVGMSDVVCNRDSIASPAGCGRAILFNGAQRT
jgi:hypothetical protein